MVKRAALIMYPPRRGASEHLAQCEQAQPIPMDIAEDTGHTDSGYVIDPAHGLDEDIIMSVAPPHHESFDEDPFNFGGLGFDEAGDSGAQGSGSGDTRPAQGADSQPGAPQPPPGEDIVDDAAAAQPMDIVQQEPTTPGGSATANCEAAPTPATVATSSAGESGELTRSGRRTAMMERLAEAKRRRQCEASAAKDAWADISAAVSSKDLSAASFADLAPPFATHDTHALIACGGYYGCVRCGSVVGWQRHAQLGAPCRGTCPRGSVRAIRRLAQGLHPFERGKEDTTCAWPSGETNPKPLRLRVARS